MGLFKFKKNKLNSIADFKDIHKGKRCFIIGNGPSLTFEDLDKLKDEITFGVNKVYLAFDKTKWRPTYYVAQDPTLIPQIIDEVQKNADIKIKFIANHNQNIPSSKNGKTFMYNYECKIELGIPTPFSLDVAKKINEGTTVTYTCLQLAMYMGFTEVYLIGMDLNYSVQQTENGLEVNNVKDHFVDSYFSDFDKREAPNIEKSKQSYESAKNIFEGNGAKIFNATRGGKLDIFERVNFDDIIDKK